MNPKHKIGDKVWVAETSAILRKKECEECCGSRYLTVIMGDGTQVTIECEGCSPGGYESARGYNTYREHVSEPREITISGMEVRPDKITYHERLTDNSWRNFDESSVFTTKEEAAILAKEMAKERTALSTADIQKKYNRHQTWSWNATYHRKAIRRLENSLEHHRKALDYANTKKK